MAEGWARAWHGDKLEVYSAGVEVHGMNARAVTVMAQAGVDISKQRSKHVDELKAVPFDAVITLCGGAAESCPVFAGGARVLHVGFDDPPKLTAGLTDEEAILTCYRRVRDEIQEFIQGLPDFLRKKGINV